MTSKVSKKEQTILWLGMASVCDALYRNRKCIEHAYGLYRDSRYGRRDDKLPELDIEFWRKYRWVKEGFQLDSGDKASICGWCNYIDWDYESDDMGGSRYYYPICHHPKMKNADMVFEENDRINSCCYFSPFLEWNAAKAAMGIYDDRLYVLSWKSYVKRIVAENRLEYEREREREEREQAINLAAKMLELESDSNSSNRKWHYGSYPQFKDETEDEEIKLII